ncbi:MAG: DUF1501 domain-containing protein [Planctomycetota bacterium]
MSTTRRDFLVGGLSAGAAVPLLGARAHPSWLSASAKAAAPGDQILVIVQARGGYDYVNMLPMVDDPTYQAARPSLKLPKSKVLTLKSGEAHYWHPGLAAFKALFDAGDLAVIRNVGYPKPNLSHFESEKKWYSADPTVSVLKEGWLATYLKKGYTGTFQIPAMDIQSRMSNAFSGSRVPVFTNPSAFAFQFDALTGWDSTVEAATIQANAAVPRPGADDNLKFVAGGVTQAFADSNLIQTAGANYTPKATYPNNSLARRLQLAARYIVNGVKTQVYYTDTGGFDNHANEIQQGTPELGRFNDLLTGMSGAIKAFLDDIKAYGYDKKVVVMLFSEFGRRVGENGSLGTDHGHGGVAFVGGAPVTGGLYGKWPDLSKATTPYNRYWIPFDTLSTDFRSMYATLIDRWLGASHKDILGGTFPLLGFL